ncbi:TPA: hypothetical protein ACJETC_005282 [Pseudomonas aeruginosa]
MNNKPTLNHHHQTALLYLYNNPSQPPFTGPNNKALNELRQMGYVKAKEFENWAGTGRIRAEWMLTKAGIEFVDNEILRKCAACTGIGQSLLRGKCTVCNGSGQVWISDDPQRHFEDCPQCAPKLEKTDANRLAEVIEISIRLEKELEESENSAVELAASQAEKAEAKRPAVVGYRSVESGMVYEQDYGLKDPEALTTVAECDNIVGELRAMVAELKKKLGESEKRGSELAASYCDGVVGDEYGHTYCRYKTERDAALAEVERLRESKGDPSGSFDRCMKMMYERDENAKRLDAALARVAELEEKLTDWVREGFRLNEALAVAKSRYGAPEGYALIPVKETEAMHDAVMALLYNGVARTDTQKLLDAYINAATNKESV